MDQVIKFFQWEFIYLLGIGIVLIMFLVIKFTPKRYKILYTKTYTVVLTIVLIISLLIPAGIHYSFLKEREEVMTTYPEVVENVKTINRGNKMEDYEIMRESYYKLVEINQNSKHYDLSSYLQSVEHEIKEILLLGITWSDESGHKFQLYISADDRMRLFTELPDYRDPDKRYYYTNSEDWYEIGFKIRNDNNEQFNAYRIESISENEIKIYCYKDGATYTLYPE